MRGEFDQMLRNVMAAMQYEMRDYLDSNDLELVASPEVLRRYEVPPGARVSGVSIRAATRGPHRGLLETMELRHKHSGRMYRIAVPPDYLHGYWVAGFPVMEQVPKPNRVLLLC